MHYFFRKKRDRIFTYIMFISVSLGVVFASYQLKNLSFEDTFVPPPVQASKFDPTVPSGHRLYGFAWNDNIGWISFNSDNCTDKYTGTVPTGCPGGLIPDYGVTYDITDGNMKGFAWSENVGWIAFEKMGRCKPASSNPGEYCTISTEVSVCGALNDCDMSIPTEQAPSYAFSDLSHCTSCTDANNCISCIDFNETPTQIKGWAKILNMDEDGWIMIGSSTVTDYQITLDNGEFKGWGWNANTNGSGIGWISFNSLNEPGPSPVYAVINTNIEPEVKNLALTPQSPGDICLNGGNVLYADIEFKYIDYDGDDIDKFIINLDGCEIEENNPLVDGYCNFGGDCSYHLDNSFCSSPFDYNSTHTLSVKVVDIKGATSTKSTPANLAINMLPNNYPSVDFDWVLHEFSEDEEVKFTSDSIFDKDGTIDCPGGVESACYLWDFTGTTSPALPPFEQKASTTIVTFEDVSSWSSTLTVTNPNTGFTCASSTGPGIGKEKLPTWIEK